MYRDLLAINIYIIIEATIYAQFLNVNKNKHFLNFSMSTQVITAIEDKGKFSQSFFKRQQNTSILSLICKEQQKFRVV